MDLPAGKTSDFLKIKEALNKMIRTSFPLPGRNQLIQACESRKDLINREIGKDQEYQAGTAFYTVLKKIGGA